MIDTNDCEAVIKSYSFLDKKCRAIDAFINNHAFYFGPVGDKYTATDIYESIIDLIERKNQLINLKIIFDDAVNALPEHLKQQIVIRMHYNITIEQIAGVLKTSTRTISRRYDEALKRLALNLNLSKYANKFETLFRKEEWMIEKKNKLALMHENYSKQPSKFKSEPAKESFVAPNSEVAMI